MARGPREQVTCRLAFDIAPEPPQSQAVPRPSFLLSFLAIQSLRLGDRFAGKYPGHWLIWEPGQWQPPSRDLLQTMNVSAPSATRPSQTDALCFQLGGDEVRIGRAPENDCVLSDATVSREHLQLLKRGDTWFARPLNERAVLVNGALFTEERALRTKDQVQLGNVTLTFDDIDGIQARMKP